MTTRVALAMFCALLMPAAIAAPAAMQPGLWEITTRMEMPGMPVAMPPQTLRHCYSEQDVRQGDRTVPRGDNQGCEVKDYKLSGNTATWTIRCQGEAAMTGQGSMTMTPTSYTGKMVSSMTQGGQTLQMTHHWSAKRIGECKP